MKTRIITAVVGLAVLAVVLAFFDTILFDLVLAAICLLAIHEVFTAMGFGKKQWYLYAAAVPFTMLLMLSSSGAARAALLAVGFLTVLFYNVVLITHDKTLDFGKLSGFIYFSGVILFCFYSLIHLKRCLPMDMYGYDAIYFILLILCFAWTIGGVTRYGLGAPEFVAHIVEQMGPALHNMLPAVVFLIACGLGFATGTSWGTFGILLPIVLEIFTPGGFDNLTVDALNNVPILMVGIGATLGGAVCDHYGVLGCTVLSFEPCGYTAALRPDCGRYLLRQLCHHRSHYQLCASDRMPCDRYRHHRGHHAGDWQGKSLHAGTLCPLSRREAVSLREHHR